jgi:K+-sensing histidine kinase KdpD
VKTAILRAVSHDLRSPLTAIRVAAESLASPSVIRSEGDKARQLETVRDESARLHRLVANLLDLSRLEAGIAVSQRELVAVDELVSEALVEFGNDCRVRVELPPDPPLVEVDPVQVERVLVNLLENALRLSPSEADVVIRVSSDDQEVVVRVVDKGPGVPASELDRSSSRSSRALTVTRAAERVLGSRSPADSPRRTSAVSGPSRGREKARASPSRSRSHRPSSDSRGDCDKGASRRR